MTYQQDLEIGNNPYDMRLCKLVSQPDSTKIWNNAWLLSDLTRSLSITSIVKQDVLKSVVLKFYLEKYELITKCKLKIKCFY